MPLTRAMDETAARGLRLRGFRVGAVAAGLRKDGSDDLCLIVSEQPATAAGLFTRNRVCGEPVKVNRRHLTLERHRGIVANAKVSNVCTGAEGRADARAMCERAAGHCGAAGEEFLVASTGVIGPRLPMEKILPAIDRAWQARRAEGWLAGARAIMTTDTRPKCLGLDFRAGQQRYRIAGMAKGSGMIAPDMATMLCFLATDAPVAKPLLQTLLARVADRTLNCLTVDADTSTSDTMLLLAGGAGGGPTIDRQGPRAAALEAALLEVCTELARALAADGEGADHLITVTVRGARNATAARRVARCVADSPLVKTMIAGRDANVGRLAMAVGRAGVPFRAEALVLAINGFDIYAQARMLDFDEAALTATLDRDEIEIDVLLGQGPGQARVWGCDLTEDYVRINADYRT